MGGGLETRHDFPDQQEETVILGIGTTIGYDFLVVIRCHCVINSAGDAYIWVSTFCSPLILEWCVPAVPRVGTIVDPYVRPSPVNLRPRTRLVLTGLGNQEHGRPCNRGLCVCV